MLRQILLEFYISRISAFHFKNTESFPINKSCCKLSCVSNDGTAFLLKHGEKVFQFLKDMQNYSLVSILISLNVAVDQVDHKFVMTLHDDGHQVMDVDILVQLSVEEDENYHIVPISDNFHGSLAYESHFLHGHTFHLPFNSVRRTLPPPKRDRPCLWIGHRGMGANNFPFSSGPVVFSENTLSAFQRAAELDLDMIELDVQLTEDNHTVIHHEFQVCPLEHHHASSAEAESAEKVSPSPIVNKLFRSVSMQDLWHYSEEHQRKTHPTEVHRNAHFVTLLDVLQQLPTSLGINVEFKCPILQEDGYWSNGVKGRLSKEYFMNKIEYVDTILKVIFEIAAVQPDRPIVFSCFHPHISLLLTAKQSVFPVMYLTRGPTPQKEFDGIRFADPRCRTVHSAIHWTDFIHGQGIVTAAHQLLKDQSIMQLCREKNFPIGVYNHPSSTGEYYTFAKQNQVAALIIDDVDVTVENFQQLDASK